MQLIKLYWQSHSTTDLIAAALKQGKVIVGTSDTVLGLCAAATHESFAALNKIKQRYENPYLLLVNSLQEAVHLSDSLSSAARKLMEHCWPGPLTIIVKAHPTLPAYMCSQQNTIALRFPDHAGLQQLLKVIHPLFSTSANITGKKVAQTIDELDPQLTKQVSYVVVDQERQPTIHASTIVDCTKQIPVIVRQGTYPRTHIEQVLGIKL